MKEASLRAAVGNGRIVITGHDNAAAEGAQLAVFLTSRGGETPYRFWVPADQLRNFHAELGELLSRE